MRQLQPKALYTYCRAHVLKLVVLHNCKEPIVRTLINTLYIQGTIPCGYWGPKLSEWRWRWMSSILHIHLQIWLHDCIGGVWTCPELQILKQLSLDLVQATVEAETIVKILREERADDDVYQALYDEVVELGGGVDVLPPKPRCAGRQMHRNNVEADSQFHYWKFALYNVFSIILWKNWRIDSFSQNRPLQHSYQFQWICTKWLRMIKWSSNMRMSYWDINCDAFYMECRHWKAHWSGEQKPQAHCRPLWLLSCIQTYLSFWLFFWQFQWPLPLLKDLSTPWKESNISSSCHDIYQA